MLRAEIQLKYEDPMLRFVFSSEELELLAAIEGNPGLEKIAEAYGRDPTVISRMLKRISEKGPVIEKISGRWRLTDQGRKLNSLTKDTWLAQKAILHEEIVIRIGSNREFVPRVLAPELEILSKRMGLSSLVIKSFEDGGERALLEGQIDIALDCGKPFSSDISFKTCAPEPISIVCSPEFFKKHREAFKKNQYGDLPMISCDRLPLRVYDPGAKTPLVQPYQFNDIAGARAACINGLGWMFAPLYAVKSELKAKQLVKPYARDWAIEKYGVWYLRERVHLQSYVKILEDWLSKVQLSGGN